MNAEDWSLLKAKTQVRHAEGNSVCVQWEIWGYLGRQESLKLPLQMYLISSAVPCALFMEWHILNPPVSTKTWELTQPFAWTSSDFPAGIKSWELVQVVLVGVGECVK